MVSGLWYLNFSSLTATQIDGVTVCIAGGLFGILELRFKGLFHAG